MTREEYIASLDRPKMPAYSKPVFECPKCGKNSVCQNLQICLTTYPPMSPYECRKEYGGCGEYHTAI